MLPAGLQMQEKDLDRAVRDACKMFGWAYYHTFFSYKSPAGFPDCVLVRERVIYAELKGPKTPVSPRQVEWLDTLHKAGQEVYLWRPDNVQQIVDVLRATGRPFPLPEPTWRPKDS